MPLEGETVASRVNSERITGSRSVLGTLGEDLGLPHRLLARHMATGYPLAATGAAGEAMRPAPGD